VQHDVRLENYIVTLDLRATGGHQGDVWLSPSRRHSGYAPTVLYRRRGKNADGLEARLVEMLAKKKPAAKGRGTRRKYFQKVRKEKRGSREVTKKRREKCSHTPPRQRKMEGVRADLMIPSWKALFEKRGRDALNNKTGVGIFSFRSSVSRFLKGEDKNTREGGQGATC